MKDMGIQRIYITITLPRGAELGVVKAEEQPVPVAPKTQKRVRGPYKKRREPRDSWVKHVSEDKLKAHMEKMRAARRWGKPGEPVQDGE